MFADIISFERVKRAAFYVLIMAAAHMVQTLVFSHISIAGVRPLFIPAFVVAVGMFEGGLRGGVYGLFTGIFLDMAFAETTLLFTLLFSFIGFFAGMFTFFFINKKFFSYVCISLAALVATAAAQAVGPLFFLGADPAKVFFIAGMQVLLSLPFMPAAYFFVKKLASVKVE